MLTFGFRQDRPFRAELFPIRGLHVLFLRQADVDVGMPLSNAQWDPLI